MSSQYGEQISTSEGVPDSSVQNRLEAQDGIRIGDNFILEYLIDCATEVHPDLRILILSSIHRVQHNRLSPETPFSNIINSVWRSIHGRPSSDTSPYETFLLAEEVASEVMGIIRSIPVLCQDHATTETRFQALTALRQIGNMVLWAGPTELGVQVRGCFDGNSVLERSMVKIINQMTPAEKMAICDGREEYGGDNPLLWKVEELYDEGGWCLLYDNMPWVTDALHDTSLPDNNSRGDEH